MNTQKRTYSTPQIECVKLDNEISLILVSSDPDDPNASILPEFIDNKYPFKPIQC